MFYETSTRSILKSVSWRALGTLITAGVVWIVTRRFALAAGVGGAEAVAKTLLFYLHERAWDRLKIGRRRVQPAVIWFTGLPCAGKTTLARHVHGELTKRGWPSELLDGDAVRRVFPATGFTRAERHVHVCRVGHLASRMESHGIFAVAALISPYAESRAFVRGLCKRYLEIHLSTPLAECVSAATPRASTRGPAAASCPASPASTTPTRRPTAPDLTIDTSTTSVEEAGEQVMRLVIARSG